MENAAKALYIAGGVLLAVMILVAISYVISSMSVIQEENMLKEKSAQAAKFNAEFEVFNKKLMYGTDILSVINKAISNNEKYVDPRGNMNTYLNGDRYDKEYLINIVVKLKTSDDLAGQVRVYKSNEEGENVEVFQEVDATVKEVFKLNSTKPLINPELYNIDTTFSNKDIGERPSVKLKIDVVDGVETINVYTMNGTTYEQSPIVDLIREESKNLTVTVKASDIDTSIPAEKWLFATFSTATNNLKKKKFVCTDVEYCTIEGSSAYGRITKMVFEEK